MAVRIVGGLVRNQLLPQTGQTATAPTAEYATGDDGFFQAGLPLVTRFVDSGRGVVYDRATGLTWVKQPELIIPGAEGVTATNQVARVGPDYGSGVGVWVTGEDYLAGDLVATGGLFYVCAEPHESGTFATDLTAELWRETIWTNSAADLTSPADHTWAQAVTRCLGTGFGGGLEYAGFTDWRLPNVLEMLTLRDFSANAYYAAFPNPGAEINCWTSTTYGAGTTFAWIIGSTTAPVSRQLKSADTMGIRPVRGGHCIQ